MAATAIVSVASFSVVLAETFASIGLSTIVPNLFVAAAKAARGAAGTGATPELLAKLRALHDAIAPPAPSGGGAPPVATDAAIATAARAVDTAYQPTSTPAPDPTVADGMTEMFGEGTFKKAIEIVKKAAGAVDHLDLLVPKKASIDAEFEFHASEKWTAEVGIGAAVEMVTLKAGYSGLYECSSRNKVTMHVEFGLVGIDL